MVDINAFWFGPRLGPVHAACLRSFLKFDYRVRLHVYDTPEDVPSGIELFDAEELMPRSMVKPHKKSGSFATAADIYRYRILEAGLGVYVDCDVFCLKPLPEGEYIFGLEKSSRINNAVLAAPSGSSFVEYLVRSSSHKVFIPPWEKRKKKIKLAVRASLGFPVHPTQLPWGALGPPLVTHAAQMFGLMKYALPIDAFFPLHYEHVSLLVERGLTIADITTERTYALHLYNKILSVENVPENSPLGEILAT